MTEKTLIERLREAEAQEAGSDPTSLPMAKLLREAADELEEWEEAFIMYWKANQRATALWHAAHPDQKAILPDQGKMIDWLCDSIEKLRRGSEA